MKFGKLLIILVGSIIFRIISISAVSASHSQPLAQVNSVSRLAEVNQQDWAFQAFQSLKERYGCPATFFYSVESISRQQFALQLNSCLNHISELISLSKTNLLTKEELEVIKRLQIDFQAELAIFNSPGNFNLEGNQGKIEPFSTTTKLNAEVILSFIGSNNPNFKGQRLNLEEAKSDFTQPALGHRTTLNFDTSFTGSDRLRVRFRAGQIIPPLLDQTNMGGLETEIGFGGELQLTKLQYRSSSIPFIYDQIPPQNFYIILSAFGTGLDEQFFETFNPYITGSKDSFTQFAIYNPIFRQPRGVGASVGYIVSDRFRMAIGYAARGSGNEAADPSSGRGLFNGSFSTGINTNFVLTSNWMLGATYLYSYSGRDRVFLFGQTGSDSSSDPFNGNPTQAHNFGLQTTALINSKFNLAGWVGWTKAFDASTNNEADIMNWALTFVVLDAFQEGNKGGLVVGMPPKLTKIKDGNSDPDNALQVEAFYTHRVNDNIFLNPGFYVIFNPENDSRNDTIFVGLLRTTFEF